MNLFSLLDSMSANKAIAFIGETFDVSLNGLATLIKNLIGGIGIVGVGIIVFSVLLRLVVLPFDAYQRVAMRKQNQKMEEQKDKLERLKKQYENDKNMYQQKMMELYKANGISMLSSCLPMIISLVIFFVAISAYNSFSSYSILSNYNEMVTAYNSNVKSYVVEIDDSLNVATDTEVITVDGSSYIFIKATGDKYISVALPYQENYDLEYIKSNEDKYTYYVNSDALKVSEYNAEIQANVDKTYNEETGEYTTDYDKEAVKFIQSLSQKAVKNYYQENITKKTKFLWIKNIWVTDSALEHPIQTYKKFESSVSSKKLEVNGENMKFGKMKNVTNAYTEESYNMVTKELSTEKKEANGYFVLILLSIGTILLQQFVTMKSQKTQQQFSTVDGQGAMNQKTMMIMMTVMFAIFAFMYSSAFSIYMIMSNILSLITTLIINKIVDTVLEKQQQKKEQERYNKRFPGRKR